MVMEAAVEAHQAAEVRGLSAELRALAPATASSMSCVVHCELVADDAPTPAGGKKCFFIRHGEGYHNVAQREWRAGPSWDGVTEPYTIDNDPSYKYLDPSLTEKGVGQAEALKPRATALAPGLMVVSPLRRATQTGLIAFDGAVSSGLRVVANELCHEHGGRHTCDKRASKAALGAEFPSVDYSALEEEEDPYWGDGLERESLASLSMRCARYVEWLRQRPERCVVTTSHSAFLHALFNAVLTTREEAARQWFGTGEMRAVVLTFEDKP